MANRFAPSGSKNFAWTATPREIAAHQEKSMAFTIQEKRDVVVKIRAKALACPSLALIDTRGLDAAQMLALRAMARQAKCSVAVVKNTLARRAWATTPKASADALLEGSLAHVYGQGEEPARIAARFAKSAPKARVAGGFYGGAPQDAWKIKALAEMPTRDELLARLARALGEPARKLAGTLDAVADSKESGHELEAA
jgi:large subunit ribosomal protein L10